MTVQPDQIATAKKAGLVPGTVDDAATVANQVGISFYQLCALLEKETTTGRNVYGNDVGGVFRGFKEPVTECNWKAFRHEVLVNGRTSNGVGPAQLTYRDFFRNMEAEGLKPWVVRDNVFFGARLYWGYFEDARGEGWSVKSSIRRAGTKYNSGKFGFIGYGDRLYELSQKWLKLVGVADVPT